MTTRTNRRNILELREIEKVEDILEIFNENVTELNYVLRNLTLVNLDGAVVSGTIPATGTLKIPHKLKIVPKHRIILSQFGGGVIRDIKFTREYIELENLGADDANVTLIIVKD